MNAARVDAAPILAALELPARFGEVDARIDDVARALDAAPAADMVLLSEAALTGYVSPEMDFDLRRFAEPAEGETFERMCALAVRARRAIVYPFVEADRGAAFNTICALDVDGSVLFRYRKRHPWYPETWATPGTAPMPRVTWRGLRITAAICFDIHFVQDDDEDALRWADVLLFPSAWVDDDGDGRAPVLRALADTFELVIVNANWGPGVPRVPGQGRSRIVAPGVAPIVADDSTRAPRWVARAIAPR